MSQNVTAIMDQYLSKVVEIPYSEKIICKPGEMVVYRDPDGNEEVGIIRAVSRNSVDKDELFEKSKILRPATANDVQKFENYLEQGKSALRECKGLIRKHELDMQVFQANYSFDGSRLLFLFTADERIDFRDLVRDLAKSMQRQIYLRQIGPRDKAKLIGGYGKCGRKLCCHSFLPKLESISMEMVRLQALETKGSSKLSGVCSKLLCCLRYEVESYRDLREKMPNIADIIKLKKGVIAPSREAKVIALDILNKKVKLYFRDDEEYLIITADDIEKVTYSAEQGKVYSNREYKGKE